MSTMHRAKTRLGRPPDRTSRWRPAPARPSPPKAVTPTIARQKWTFGGLFGKFDDAQLQRGFRVYMEVCARCHGLSRIYFRNLAEPGGPGFPEAAVKSLAATFQYDDAPNDQGKVRQAPRHTDRPAAVALQERAGSPLRPERRAAARSLADRQGARRRVRHALLPRARQDADRHRHAATRKAAPDYVYAFLTGYAEPPAGMKMGDFMNYNKAFPGHQTAMPNPFLGGDGLVKYDDGTPTTVDNYARDVTAFLAWASRSQAGGAQAHGPAGHVLPAHHGRAVRPRQAPHLAQRALR